MTQHLISKTPGKTMAKALAIALMGASVMGALPAQAAGRTGTPGRLATNRLAPARFAVAFVDLANQNGRIVPRSQQVVAAPSSTFLQCVPYARTVSGIQLRGDAHTWWDQAAGRYQRGFTPRVGAVMAFKPYGPMVLGHVATVSRILDSRRVLVRHANWSPLGGERGQIEDNVLAMDVSARNDWSEVRVWYQPLGGLGTTHWPVAGFIYNTPVGESRSYVGANHGSTLGHYLGDPIGAIIAAYSRR
ncbi:CHAP domain-containing protein [Novosphingobium humi]|uniref:CHAP domain-containing protein n=1 Tax=Novosphingobium humi TaxID=2282397 RepID=UPI003081187E